jgi:sec-independent protein translocase protein TatA
VFFWWRIGLWDDSTERDTPPLKFWTEIQLPKHLQPQHLVVIVGIAVLFFGGKKIPELGKGIGEGFRAFRDGLKGITDEDQPANKASWFLIGLSRPGGFKSLRLESAGARILRLLPAAAESPIELHEALVLCAARLGRESNVLEIVMIVDQ